jgi:V/A-type H+-transporting ATPase subunit E
VLALLRSEHLIKVGIEMKQGLDKIIQKILGSAEKESERILSEAKKEFNEKLASTRKEAEQKGNAIIERGKREATMIEQRTLAGARIKSKQMKLNLQEKLIKEIFSVATQELTNLRKDKKAYGEAMKALIKEAGIAVGGGDLEAQVRKEDQNIFSGQEVQQLAEGISRSTGERSTLSVSPTSISTMGGVIVQRANGSVKSDNTFEARLKRMEEDLRRKVATILFKS